MFVVCLWSHSYFICTPCVAIARAPLFSAIYWQLTTTLGTKMEYFATKNMTPQGRARHQLLWICSYWFKASCESNAYNFRTYERKEVLFFCCHAPDRKFVEIVKLVKIWHIFGVTQSGSNSLSSSRRTQPKAQPPRYRVYSLFLPVYVGNIRHLLVNRRSYSETAFYSLWHWVHRRRGTWWQRNRVDILQNMGPCR